MNVEKDTILKEISKISWQPFVVLIVFFTVFLTSYILLSSSLELRNARVYIKNLISGHIQNIENEVYLNQSEAIESRLKLLASETVRNFPSSSICFSVVLANQITPSYQKCLGRQYDKIKAYNKKSLFMANEQIGTLRFGQYKGFEVSHFIDTSLVIVLLLSLLVALIAHKIILRKIKYKILLPYIDTMKKYEQKRVTLQIANQVGHDIKSPLAALNTIVQSISNLSDEKKILLSRISSRIYSIANDLQKLEGTSQPDENIEAINIYLICNGLVQEVLSDPSHANLIIELEVLTNPVGIYIKANRSNLLRALSNVINNAIEANASKIIIKMSESFGTVNLSILDNGYGLDPVLMNTFNSDRHQSTGMGVRQIQKFAREVGGKVKYVLNDQKGICVKLTIPTFECPRHFAKDIVVSGKIFIFNKSTSQAHLINPFIDRFVENTQVFRNFPEKFDEINFLDSTVIWFSEKSTEAGDMDRIKSFCHLPRQIYIVTENYNSDYLIRFSETLHFTIIHLDLFSWTYS